MKISDFKGVFKRSYAYVESIENPYDDYYIIKLRPENNLGWQPGEHAIFTLPDNKVEGKKWRAFSIASISAEKHITLGIRTGNKISSFKSQLIKMKIGERVQVRGPFGWFRVRDNETPMVMIASGVGITPIRAILKQLENDTTRMIHTVYASKEFHLFGEELSILSDQNESISLIKTESRDETTLAYRELAKSYGNDAFYYISGSMQTIKAIKSSLAEYGIKKKRIINDPFLGY